MNCCVGFAIPGVGSSTVGWNDAGIAGVGLCNGCVATGVGWCGCGRGGMPIIGCGIAGVVAGVAWFGVTSDMATDDVDVGAGACGTAGAGTGWCGVSAPDTDCVKLAGWHALGGVPTVCRIDCRIWHLQRRHCRIEGRIGVSFLLPRFSSNRHNEKPACLHTSGYLRQQKNHHINIIVMIRYCNIAHVLAEISRMLACAVLDELMSSLMTAMT